MTKGYIPRLCLFTSSLAAVDRYATQTLAIFACAEKFWKCGWKIGSRLSVSRYSLTERCARCNSVMVFCSSSSSLTTILIMLEQHAGVSSDLRHFSYGWNMISLSGKTAIASAASSRSIGLAEKVSSCRSLSALGLSSGVMSLKIRLYVSPNVSGNDSSARYMLARLLHLQIASNWQAAHLNLRCRSSQFFCSDGRCSRGTYMPPAFSINFSSIAPRTPDSSRSRQKRSCASDLRIATRMSASTGSCWMVITHSCGIHILSGDFMSTWD